MLRREHKREEERHVFWPDFAFHSAIVMLVVFIALALVALFFHPPHESVARPGDSNYIPRPEWYFLFLMEILKLFPGKLEVVGAIFLPVLAILALLGLPFFDRRPTLKPLKRPLATTAVGIVLILILALTVKGVTSTPPSITSPSAFIELGESLYPEQGCANCHTINGVGSPLGPDLAGISERRTLSWIHKYLEDPLLFKPDSAMPGYLGTITHEEIEGISMYLMTLEKTPAPTGEIPTPGEVSPPPPAPVAPPEVPHTLEGRSTCLVCHETGVGEATKIPTDHSGRSNEVCLSCHKSQQ